MSRPTPLIERLLGSGPDPAIHYLSDKDPTQVLRVHTERELSEATRAAASRLWDAGIRAGDRVVTMLPNGPEFVSWFLGALWIGAVPVPLPSMSQMRRGATIFERVRGVVGDCKPSAVVAPPEGMRWLGLSGLVRRCALLDGHALGRASRAPRPAPDAKSPIAFIQYTAGSTGMPKGVVVTRSALRANLEAIASGVKLTRADRILSWLPLYHDMGLVGALLCALHARVPLYLFSPFGFVLKPSNWLRAISVHRATLSPAPHFAYGLCVARLRDQDLVDVDLSCWRLALDGSEPVRPGTVRAFGERFAPYGFARSAHFPVYGMAEATLAITFPALGELPKIDRVRRSALTRGHAEQAGAEEADAAEFVSVGAPLEDHAVEIRLPDTGEPCPERELGEIWVRGPSISPRYFGAGPPTGDRAVDGLRTGDVGYMAEGRLHIVDRLKDLIIHGGSKYYPADIERTVEAVPGVRPGRVVAFGAPAREVSTEGVVVAVEVRFPRKGDEIAERIRMAVSRAHGLSLQAVVPLPPHALPMTINGKLMRARTRDVYLRGSLGGKAKVWPFLTRSLLR